MLSSMSSATALPAPGPATVRLALIKNAIERFGLEAVRHELFPVIRAATLRIRPPLRVALAIQMQHAYKASTGGRGRVSRLEQSLGYREMAHAQGAMTVYLQVPQQWAAACR